MKTPKENRNEVRDVKIIFAATKAEKEALQAYAQEIGITMSALCRLLINDMTKQTNVFRKGV